MLLRSGQSHSWHLNLLTIGMVRNGYLWQKFVQSNKSMRPHRLVGRDANSTNMTDGRSDTKFIEDRQAK